MLFHKLLLIILVTINSCFEMEFEVDNFGWLGENNT